MRRPAGRSPSLAAAALAAALGGCGNEAMDVRPLATPADTMPAAADPALATDPATGDLLLAWVGGSEQGGWHLWFSRSADTGRTWTPPSRVTDRPGDIQPHGEASPRLAAGPRGQVALLWATSVEIPDRKWPASDVRFARSLDGGRSWTPPVTLNDDTAAAARSGHTFMGLALTGDAGLVAAWLDERRDPSLAAPPADHARHGQEAPASASSTIYAVRSPDFGASWGPNRLLWSEVCPCCRVALAARQDGAVIAAWRKHFPGDVRDVVVSGLDSPDPPERVHADGWSYPGCPHSGPALALDAAGRAHVAWYTGKPGRAGVYLARQNLGKQGWDEPVRLVGGNTLPVAHAALASLEDGAAVATWDVDSRGRRHILVAYLEPEARRVAPQPIAGSEAGLYPQLARGPGDAVFVAWTAPVGETSRIALRVVRFPSATRAGTRSRSRHP